jgi:hypothetical protein
MQQPGKGFLVWLGGLSVLGFLATDMYLLIRLVKRYYLSHAFKNFAGRICGLNIP